MKQIKKKQMFHCSSAAVKCQITSWPWKKHSEGEREGEGKRKINLWLRFLQLSRERTFRSSRITISDLSAG